MADFSLPPKEMLLALLNERNAKSYTLTEIDFSGVQSGSFVGGRNTSVSVIAIPGQGYTGAKTIFYNRVSLSTLFPSGLNIASAAYANTGDLVPVINSLFNFNLSVDDIIVEPIVLDENNYGVATLTAAPTSLLMIGSMQVTIGTAIPNDAITGFDGEPLTGFDGEFITYFAVA